MAAGAGLATLLVSTPMASADGADSSSSPPDLTNYSRPAVRTDRPFRPFAAIKPDFFSKEIVNLAFGEPSLAINPSNPLQIVATTFAGGWATNQNTTLFFSQDGGQTWTAERSVTQPPGISTSFLTTIPCPCDQTVDYGRDGRLYGTFLLDDGTNTNIVTGSTTDPSQAASWSWNTPSGVTQLTNAAHQNNADQPWLIVNRDPSNASQDNVYIGYDDFNGSPDARVSVSRGSNPVTIATDAKAGTESPNATNPGLRLTADPRNGSVYAVYEQSSGSSQPKNVTYKLNRSTDGGNTWSLNGSSDGLTVDSVKSDQAPGFKFGTVNALLGGVDHVAVDPSNGDVYVVYGVDNGAGGNQLELRRMTNNGSGGLNVGPALAVTASTANAALPSIAIGTNRTIAILYDSFDGIDASSTLPKFSAHLARSTDQGTTFGDEVLLSFLSPAAADNSKPRQRVFGDYQQIKNVGSTFFGVFSANAAALGNNTAATDAVFFRTLTPTTLNIDGPTTADFDDAVTVTATLRDVETNVGISGQSVSFTLNGTETCTGITSSNGQASCSITPREPAGTYPLNATFGPTFEFQGFATATNFVVTREQTTLTYTGSTVIANGGTAHMTAVLLEDGTTPPNPSGQLISFTLGSGATAQTCSAPADATGTAKCDISPVSQPLGAGSVSASFAGDAFYLPSSDSKSTVLFAFLAHGSFVVGDRSAASAGASVTFWGAQWAQTNQLSGGSAPDSFKGFASTTATTPPACGQNWSTDPGNSASPPETVPSFMAVVVSNEVVQSGDESSGTVQRIIVVQTNGYGRNPGHAGIGSVVASPSNPAIPAQVCP